MTKVRRQLGGGSDADWPVWQPPLELGGDRANSSVDHSNANSGAMATERGKRTSRPSLNNVSGISPLPDQSP